MLYLECCTITLLTYRRNYCGNGNGNGGSGENGNGNSNNPDDDNNDNGIDGGPN